MKQNYLKTILCMLMLCVGMSAWAQEVTLDFTTNSWGLPEGSTKKATAEASFTSGGYTIKLKAGTGYYYGGSDANGHYLILGKTNATLELPAFDFAVNKIEVYGTTTASASVVQNIFVGENAASTATTGAAFEDPTTECNSYAIAKSNQAAGTIYTLKVTSNHNTQISSIKIYKATAGAPEAPTFSVASGTYTSAQTVAITSATEGAEIYYTLDGTDPTSASTKYTSALNISKTTTIKAVAIKGGVSSTIESVTYTFVTTTGQGTKENPYTVADVKLLNNPGTKAWVEGPVYGVYNAKSEPITEIGEVASNIAIGAGDNIIPVALTYNTAARNDLNLVDNAYLVGKTIKVYGELVVYFKTTGVKNASDFVSPCYQVSVTDAGYATYYNSTQAYTLPEGVSGYVAFIDAAAGNKFTFDEAYESGKIVPANEALVLKAAPGTYTLTFTNDTPEESFREAGMNDLKGTDVAANTEGGDDYHYYMLSLNAANELSSVGFYFENKDGKAFQNGAHKAYLAYTAAQVGSVKEFRFNDYETGVQDVDVDENADQTIYDLSGRKVSNAQKGIYIKNGRKFMK